MTRLVAFCGRAGAGKSTAADALVAAGWRRVKFASILKDMLRAFYRSAGLDEAEIERRIEGDLKEEPDPILCGASPRRAMVTLGTEWGRHLISPELWVRAWSARVERELARGASVVCDDLRFPNECDAVRALGGLVVRIEGRAKDVAAHESEALDFEPDVTISNTGTEDDLRSAARLIGSPEDA